MRANSAAERFWSHVLKTAECWLWTGATRSGGYGVFRDGSRSVSAHRFAWEMEFGPIPAGTGPDGSSVPWLISHGCGNRRCVRPDHLRLLPPVTSGASQPETAATATAGAPPPVAGGAAMGESRLLRGLRTWQDSIDRGARLSERLASSITDLRSELGTLRGDRAELAEKPTPQAANYETEPGLAKLRVTDGAEATAPAKPAAGH